MEIKGNNDTPHWYIRKATKSEIIESLEEDNKELRHAWGRLFVLYHKAIEHLDTVAGRTAEQWHEYIKKEVMKERHGLQTETKTD
jgi:hypothetical protein